LIIDSLLNDLVSTVDGATGAILLEADGEAVRWHSPDGDRLRLRGAYVALVLKSCRASAVREILGGLNFLILAYDGATFVAQEINRDCVVVVELASKANVAQAIFQINPSVEKLRREIDPQ